MRGSRLSLEAPAMPAIAMAIILASGWRRRLIAFAAGATGALAMAPFNFFPALIIPMTAAVWLIDGCAETRQKPAGERFRLDLPAAAWRAFAVGWWWGFGYFVAGLWWLGAAFLVEADEFAWALPLGVVGLPAVLAVFPGLGFLLARLIWTPGAGRLFALAAGLSFTEWLRGHVLTGFPWNTFGMALGGNLRDRATGLDRRPLRSDRHCHPYFFRSRGAWRKISRCEAQGAGLPVPILAAILAFCGICGFGAWRLAHATPELVAGVRLRIMQPNLPQDAKFRPENKALDIIALPGLVGARVGPAITPASTMSPLSSGRNRRFLSFCRAMPELLPQIGAILPQDTVLVTGAAREEDRAWRLAPGDARYFNAIQVVASGGHILDSYDKVHLVPFGEYLPFQNVFDRLGLHQFVHVPGGFEAGSGRRHCWLCLACRPPRR